MTRARILICFALDLWSPFVLHWQKESVVEQQFIAADRSYFEALAGPHPDMTSLKRLLGPEYTHVDQDGSEARADVLKEVEHLLAPFARPLRRDKDQFLREARSG